MSENKKVHRRLTVISPAIKGDDVKALQRNINERYKHFKVDRRVAVDGEFGRQTLNAAWQIAKAMVIIT
jgi:lysozyme family protein